MPDRETPRAQRAWLDYLEMGPGRSLPALIARYVEVARESGERAVPTRNLQILQRWSSAFGWQDRLRAIADQERAEAEARIREERRRVFEDGLAFDFERVRVLKRLAQKLIDDLMAEDDPDAPRDRDAVVREVIAEAEAVLKGTWIEPNRKRRRGLWLRDAKALGNGASPVIGFFESFNRDEVECLRGLFDDIAKETGGRPRTVKIDVEQRLRVVAEEEARRLGLSEAEAIAQADAVLREARGNHGRR